MIRYIIACWRRSQIAKKTIANSRAVHSRHHQIPMLPKVTFVATNEGRNTNHHTMIAAIEWIPAGRANPNPSKYEYSRAEREFLLRVQEQAGGDGEANDDDDDVGADAAKEKNAAAGGGEAGSGSDEDWEDVANEDSGEVDEEEEEEGGKGGGGRRDDDNEKTIDPSRLRLPKIDPSSLPADLRMDEYSDDDDEDDDGVGEKNVGDLLGVGKVWWSCNHVCSRRKIMSALDGRNMDATFLRERCAPRHRGVFFYLLFRFYFAHQQYTFYHFSFATAIFMLKSLSLDGIIICFVRMSSDAFLVASWR